MNIIINGAGGRMGKALTAMIQTGCRNAKLAGAVDPYVQHDGIVAQLTECTAADCIIDFSNHAGTQTLTNYAVDHNLPLVVATTGHTPEEVDLIHAAAKKIPVFFSGNMSLGIALLTELAKQTAQMFPDADIEIVEAHHNQKLDAPSGTALMLAKAVQEVRPQAQPLVGRNGSGKRTQQEIGIHSLRMGNTVGWHEVIVNTGTQIITLKHEAQDRALFAEGALAAAAFLIGKAPGLYTMKDIVKE